LKYTQNKIFLHISDNGVGFDIPQQTSAGIKGKLELLGMKERAQLVGAKLKIKSTPGHGTAISVEIPL
jgi:two-component system, NarL family, sensor histidine kinase DegS